MKKEKNSAAQTGGQRGKGAHRPKIVSSTQEFSPIADIKDGIIITKDSRFIKIIEVSAINFALRSAPERDAIISCFAAAIKAMPDKIQFKVVAKKADVQKYLTRMQADLQRESNAKCRQLGSAQIELVRDIGNRRGISRRFFIIIQYEERPGLLARPTFDEISAQLHYTASRIGAMLYECENEIVSVDYDDKYTLSVLYSIFSRSNSMIEPFEERYEAVGRNYRAGENIPVNDFIAPDFIDTASSHKYIKVDDLYYAFLYVPGSSYPNVAGGGWMSNFIDLGDGVDVDLFVSKQPTETVMRKLQYALRYNKVKLKNTDDTNIEHDELSGTLQSGYNIRAGLQAGDDFCNFAVFLTVTASTAQSLDRKLNEIITYLATRGLTVRQCRYECENAFKSLLPICNCDPSLFKRAKRNILHSDLASAYPFTSYELADPNGIFLGTNGINSSPIFVDNFAKQYKNANIAILGTSGSGKTYTLQCMALRMREQHTQVFIIAPDKGHEFKRACDAIGGQYIKIAPSSGQNINIMEIRKADDTVSKLIDGDNNKDSILMKKIQKLHAFFSLLVPDISYEERQQLDEAIIRTYQKLGITNRNKSLIDTSSATGYKQMPTLADLYKELASCGPKAKRLHTILARYVTGSAKNFSAQTNVDLNNKYIVLDVSELTKELLPIGMFLALDYVYDKAREDRTKRKAIFTDELWTLIGAKSSAEAAEFVLEIFKVIRGYGGAAIAATQDLNDFFALEDGKYGKGIINNAKIKIVMGVEQEEAERISSTLGLSPTEAQQITRMKRGEGLLVANKNHVIVNFLASQTEHDLITTDRADLQKQLEDEVSRQEQEGA